MAYAYNFSKSKPKNVEDKRAEEAQRRSEIKLPVAIKAQAKPISADLFLKKAPVIKSYAKPPVAAKQNVSKVVPSAASEKDVSNRMRQIILGTVKPTEAEREQANVMVSKTQQGVFASKFFEPASLGFSKRLESEERKKNIEETSKKYPKTALLGTITGYIPSGIASTAIAGGAIAKTGLSGLKALTATGALAGGLEEAAIGVGSGQSAKDVLKRTALGASVGGATALGGVLLGKGIKSIRQPLSNVGDTISKNTKLYDELVSEKLVGRGVKNPMPKMNIQEELGIPKKTTASEFAKQLKSDSKAIAAEKYYKSLEKSPEEILSNFTQWRKTKFGGAFGNMSDEDTKALKQLYLEDTGIDLEGELKSASKGVVTKAEPVVSSETSEILAVPKTFQKSKVGRGNEGVVIKPAMEEIEQSVTLKYNPTTEEFEEVLSEIPKSKSSKSILSIPKKSEIVEPKISKSMPLLKDKENFSASLKLTSKEISDSLNDFKVSNVSENKIELPIPPKGKKLKGFVANTITDKGNADSLRISASNIDMDEASYSVLGNQEVLDSAVLRFSKGFDTAKKDLYDTIDDLRPDNVVLAKLLAKEANKRGDDALADEIIVKISDKLLMSGRYSQSAKILRVSDSPSALKGVLEKQLKMINKQGIAKFGKKWNDLKLTDADKSLISKFKSGDDKFKQELMEELQKSLSSQIKVTNLEKFNALRHMNMLLNPKTQARNLLGNTLMMAETKIADTVATGLEKFIPKNQRTKAILIDKKVKDIAEKAWQSNKADIQSNSRLDIEGINFKILDREKTIFNTKALEEMRKFTNAMMEKGDIGFLRHEFKSSLGQFMTARNLEIPTQEAIEYAKRRALEQTFRNANAFSTFVAKQKNKGAISNVFFETFVPFSKTPSNVVLKALDFSPIGLIKGISQVVDASKSPAMAIESLSQGITGTALAGVGAYLASRGWARGNAEKSSALESQYAEQGKMPRSIVIPNLGSVSISELQPSSFPLIIGIMMYESASGKFENPLDIAMSAIENISKSAEDLPMVGNITDMFSTPENFAKAIATAPFEYTSQAVPTVFGQISRIEDENKRSQTGATIPDEMLNKLKAKDPLFGLQKTLPKKYDVFGKEVKKIQNVGTRALQESINPVNVLGIGADAELSKKIMSVYNSIESKELKSAMLPKVAPYYLKEDGKTYTFTPEERQKFQESLGKKTKRRLEALIYSSQFSAGRPEDKAKFIKNAIEQAYEDSKNEYMKGKK